MSAGDQEIVEALVAGQAGSWELFVARYAGTVRAAVARVLLAQTGRAAAGDVDDLCEDVFLLLLERDRRLLRRYDPQHALRAYLAVIARTAVHRALRRRRASGLGELAAAELADSSSGVESKNAKAEVVDAVRAELGELSAREQQLLRLYYFEGRDYRAIAEELDVSMNSVGAALSRARAKLAKGLRARQDLSESDLRAV